VRDAVIDFVRIWSDKTELIAERFIGWLELSRGKFFDWKKRYGTVNEHNCHVPRDCWVTDEEKTAIVAFHDRFPLEGYRRLTFMMIDQDVAFVAPATTYRILKAAGRLDRWNRKPSLKGTGFVQPTAAHQHWHIDIAYLNLAGTFYYLCSVLDGFSRAIVHWEIRESMRESEVELVLQRARELQPDAKPRIISDNGPQFIARDFKDFIRVSGMTHVRISPHYPQSNGKIERWHKTLKSDAIRVRPPSSLEEAQAVVARFVEHYNAVRLHSSLGYVAPADMIAGRAAAIHAARDQKLERAREQRRLARAAARAAQPKPAAA
jgi:transposase InsO family protein